MQKKIDFTRGSGEFIAFAIIAPMICFLLIMACAYIQLSISIHNLTEALNVSSRSVAVCTSMEDAKIQALAVADTSIVDNNIHDMNVEIAYANGDTEWGSGVLLTVTISADIETVLPFISSGRRSKTTVVCVENQTLNTTDVNLLAALISTEASASNYEAMLAVGTVVINRLNSSAYPNTLRDVIYQSGQFEVTWSSATFTYYVQHGSPERAIQCAEDILRGSGTDVLIINNCTQFRTHRYMYNGRLIDSSISHPNGIDIGGNWFFW